MPRNLMPEENLLGEALESAETPTPDPAQVEQTETPVVETTGEEQPKQEPTEAAEESQADRDFKELRERRDYLNTVVTQAGGESQLQIMAPFLQVAQEMPSNPAELEAWTPRAWESLTQTLLPEQVKAMKDEAAWSYLTDPASARVIAESIYGVTPDILKEFAEVYRQDPEGVMGVLRPGYSEADRRAMAAEQAANDLKASIEADKAKSEAAELQRVGREVMTHVLTTGLSPRAEIKKQYGLEFQKSDNDTPEISAFKERASGRYDRMVKEALSNDPELNRLSNAAEHLSAQKDTRMRQRAENEFAPLIQQRTRAVCIEIAKDLAADLKLFSPELSDRAKANNLKDLPAQLGSAGAAQSGKEVYPLYDESGRPDPRLHQQIKDFLQNRAALPAG